MTTLKLEKQGESLTFFGEADSTASSMEVGVSMAPGAEGPPPHIHTKQSETFQVTSGRLVAMVDGQEHTAEAGQTVVVQAGQAHTFANGSETEPLVFRATFEPALNFQWALTELAKSAIRAGGSWANLPLPELAYILRQVRDEYRVAGIPFVLQDVLFGLLARVAELQGRAKEIAPMSEVDRQPQMQLSGQTQ
jgi:quercetin dioxygenase-like cupin family protein